MMRIITGKAKGIKLKTLEGMNTRPTAERVKEAIFSTLQFDLEGRKILDLFSGSGQMALEALSRGASEAVMIDKSSEAIKIIRENSLKTGLDKDCQIYNCDALEFIKRFPQEKSKFDIVFLDPPYASNLYFPILDGLIKYHVIKPTSIVVCESDTNIINDSIREQYQIVKSSKYGRINITILTPIS